ncbi:arginase [Paragonimus westermani]|uniref:Arginase n=1 Tax=Paragonimus westermani TaxID=34504 RepID=A0A5J4NW58_9TREM|nr:arginase [Paragonimus westermani]
MKDVFPSVDLKSATLQRGKPLILYPHVSLIGAPVRRGQPKDGTHLGPRMIRESNVIQSLRSVGITVEDHGDIALEQDDPKNDSPIYNMINPRSFVDTTEKIATSVEQLLRSNTSTTELCSSPLVVVGGDHSMATGTILGHWRVKPDVCIIWVDSHGDLNTPFTCICGNMHGFPLAFLLKEIQDEMPYVKEMESIEPCLSASDIVYIGLRDLDPHEVYDLRKNNIKHYTMMDVDRMGIEAVIHEAIQSVNPRLDRPIHLSFDIDAMDPSIAPSTGTPVPGGLTLREGLRICEEVYATGE